MTTVDAGTRKVFRYNLSFYYQSTIIYFIALILYVVVKGEFIEDSFRLIMRDPVIYFFILIVLISLVSLLYNLYLNRHIEITGSELILKKGSKTRVVRFSDIQSIRIAKERRRFKSNSFSLVRIKVIHRRLPLIIIPYDYENKKELIEALKRIKNNIGHKDNV
ncbi:MAG: hypothetical protein ACM3S2_11625 [Ignavibacteriales bacterium]